jgi:hypothetical protein
MAEILLAMTEAHELGLTSQFFFLENGDTGYANLGNAKSVKDASSHETKTHKIAHNGVRKVNDEQVTSVHRKYEVITTEFGPDALRYKYMATKGADVVQAAVTAPTGSATINGVKKGRSYFIGPIDVNTVVVTISAVAKTVDVDYTIDLANGRIYIIPSGSIADGANLSVTYGNAARTTNTFTANQKSDFRGTFRVEHRNPHDDNKVPLYIETFTGTLIVTAFPERNEENAEMTYTITQTSDALIKKRHAAIS